MEEWRDIEGYEGLYQVSNRGRIKRLSGKVKHPTGSMKTWKERLLKPQDDGRGYLHVRLSKNGVIHIRNVHRIVAETFIDNVENKPQVNHIDGNKKNNHVDNLEWATSKENINHSLQNGLRGQDRRSRAVLRSDGEIFPSINSAAKATKTSSGNVSQVINGKRNHAKGYGFKLV